MHQVRGAERFGQEFGEIDPARLLLHFALALAGHDDDRQPRAIFVLADAAHRLEAVHARELHIRDDEVDLHFRGFGEGFFPGVRGLHPAVDFLQAELDQFHDVRVVVYYEYRLHAGLKTFQRHDSAVVGGFGPSREPVDEIEQPFAEEVWRSAPEVDDFVGDAFQTDRLALGRLGFVDSVGQEDKAVPAPDLFAVRLVFHAIQHAERDAAGVQPCGRRALAGVFQDGAMPGARVTQFGLVVEKEGDLRGDEAVQPRQVGVDLPVDFRQIG